MLPICVAIFESAKPDEELARNKDQFMRIEPPLNHDILYLGFAKSMNMQPFLQAFNQRLAAARRDPESSARTAADDAGRRGAHGAAAGAAGSTTAAGTGSSARGSAPSPPGMRASFSAA